MKALLNILVTAAIFFSLSVIANRILGDQKNSRELLRIGITSIIFGIVMYPTGRFINRRFGKGKIKHQLVMLHRYATPF